DEASLRPGRRRPAGARARAGRRTTGRRAEEGRRPGGPRARRGAGVGRGQHRRRRPRRPHRHQHLRHGHPAVQHRPARRQAPGERRRPARRGGRRVRRPGPRRQPAGRHRPAVRLRAAGHDPHRRQGRQGARRAVLQQRPEHLVPVHRGRAVLHRVPPEVQGERAVLRQLRRHVVQRVDVHRGVQGRPVRPEQGGHGVGPADHADRLPVREPPRRQDRVRPRRLPVRRRRRRRVGGRRARRRPGPEHLDGQDAPDRRERGRPEEPAVHDPRYEPAGQGGRPAADGAVRQERAGVLEDQAEGQAGDLGVRHPQPVDVQLRPQDRRFVHRRRRAEPLGRSQLPAGRQQGRRELRVGAHERHPPVPAGEGAGRRADAGDRRAAGGRVQPRDRRHLRGRHRRLPRQGVPEPRRHLLLRRLGQRPALGPQARRRRQVADAGAAEHEPELQRRRRGRGRQPVRDERDQPVRRLEPVREPPRVGLEGRGGRQDAGRGEDRAGGQEV
ncbi:MAG: hypothetical protein AVDCRST_MAG64-3106, partial [uncultured Phycisphaerae bacterium]